MKKSKQLIIASLVVVGAIAAAPTPQANAAEGRCDWSEWIGSPFQCFKRLF